MSEVAGPTSLVEPFDPHAADVKPPFMTAEEESQTVAAPRNAKDVPVPTQAPEPSKDALSSPPTVSPDASPASPPDLSKAVSANPPPPKLASVPSTPPQSFLTSNRRRVVSLDRGHTLHRVVSLDRGRELLAEMYGKERSSDLSNGAEGRRELANSYEYDIDDGSLSSDSSDDESSYFAKKEYLPKPKSGRCFSYSDSASISSAPARAGPYAPRSSKGDVGSDASLSFSDDDDDDHVRPGMNIITSRVPKLPPPVSREGSYEYQPSLQSISRLHSMNSLVSSSEDEGNAGIREKTHPRPRTDSSGSLSTTDGDATSIDSSTRNELHHVAVPTTSRSASTGSAPPPSGRMPPVLGAHYSGIFGGYNIQTPPSVPHGSPPPIFQGQPPPGAQEVAHPQPRTSEEMSAWLASGNMLLPPFMTPPFFPALTSYGATTIMANSHSREPNYTSQQTSDGVNSSMNSAESASLTLTMAYSEDDETDDWNVGHKAARSGSDFFYQGSGGAQFNSNVDNGLGSGLEGGHDVTENHHSLGQQHVANVRSGSSQDRASGNDDDHKGVSSASDKGFSVYWQRWLMLMYMSVLNLLSDWTCYSVAPISLLTSEAFGNINPEQLVVVFLCANAVSTACEPIILSRLGLRRTVLFGAFLLMLGSVVKSGGLPPIVQPTLVKGQGEWRVYLGFFLVGLSQPLYQCTPALLSASWFPERERTMATGVALNANQLGIGFAFIFGTLLVADSDDIVRYFGLLSTISAIMFLGCLFQFDDAPPTPPSDTARVMRGTFELKLPLVDSILKSVRSVASIKSMNDDRSDCDRSDSNHSSSRKSQTSYQRKSQQGGRRSGAESGRSGRRSVRSSSASSKSASPQPTSRKQTHLVRQSSAGPSSTGGTGSRRRSSTARSRSATSESGLTAAPGLAEPPSPASTSMRTSRTSQSALAIVACKQELYAASVLAPSPMMPGPVGTDPLSKGHSEDESPLHIDDDYAQEPVDQRQSDGIEPSAGQDFPHVAQYANQYPPRMSMPYQYPQWQQGYWDPQYHHQAHLEHPAYQQYPSYFQQQGYHHQQQGYFYYPQGYYYPQRYPHVNPQEYQSGYLPNTSDIDVGAEPTVTLSAHHLDIHIRDDQVLLSARACLSRPGFIHSLVAFTVSGIVINTLSTFMDYLVRLNGAGREYTGIVGGTFQFVIMISSLIIGKATDHSRAYYSVILVMLVLGAFGLAECGVSLDADRGTDLRWMLIVVAALVGPLQPVSTELGVDVAYPLSENTVLVIQQLFSNLLSALFIPFFKVLKDVGNETIDDAELYERPEYTFSFYLLIVLHASATVFFATFNGRYLRYEHENEKKAQNEAKAMFAGPTAFHPVHYYANFQHDSYEGHGETSERGPESQPLLV